MNQQERCLWLIRALLEEMPQYRDTPIPALPEHRWRLLRSLMNVRPPRPVSQAFLAVQNAYLQEENQRAGITDIRDLNPCELDDRVFLWQGDMTALRVDAIVNPANSALLGCFRPLHSCADNIIHSKSGIQLRLRCSQIMNEQGHEEPTGHAKITPGYNLPCKYIIHTVGPIVDGPLTKEHEQLLTSCYRSCLELAELNHCESIAFCCISTGVFMFPNQRAAEIAVETVRKYYRESGSQLKIVFNVYKDVDFEIYDAILKSKAAHHHNRL